MFQVGDRVWDTRYGWGEVYYIDSSSLVPVKASFVSFGKKIYLDYTLGGRLGWKGNRTLFFDELIIPESALLPERAKNEPQEIINRYLEK